MIFDRDYDALLARAADLGQYESGYLDVEDQKAFVVAKNEYREERDRTAYAILSEKPDLDLVYQRIREDLAAVSQQSPEWDEVCTFVAEDLIEKLQEESGKSPLRRTVIRYGGMLVLATLAIGYFGLWWYNDLTIDQSLETKEGLVQHAAAYDKARNYDDWASTRTRRGGFLKGILLKPLEPDDEEVTAATDFIGLTFEGLAMLTEEGTACNAEHLLAASEVSDTHLVLLDKVSAHVQDPTTEWQDPPITTIVQPLLEEHGCPVSELSSDAEE